MENLEPDEWIKIGVKTGFMGTGVKTGFMANFQIPGTNVIISYDAGDMFWNLSEEDKVNQATRDVIKELKG